MSLIFFISLFFLMSIWLIYPLSLKLSSIFKSPFGRVVDGLNIQPSVSVIIAAHNEANNLKKRCENIFSQSYFGAIEVIIASDGSTDGTNDVVQQLTEEFRHIIYLDIQPQCGRSNAHNLAVKKANHDLLVFTDAETEFEPEFLLNLVTPFSDSSVGFVSGKLKYRNAKSNSISESVNLYWCLEMFMRHAESMLGIYAMGTGACCAIRKPLYKTIPATGDVDFITPLDVVLQGKKCVHVGNAIAWDELPDSPRKEFSARVRMTSKNLTGTLKRWGWRSLVKHPLYSITIFLHKIGRWLTPFFLIGLLMSNIVLLFGGGYLFVGVFVLQVSFYVLGLLGFFNVNILYSRQVYSFLLANAGFLMGVLQALVGRTPKLYTPMSQ